MGTAEARRPSSGRCPRQPVSGGWTDFAHQPHAGRRTGAVTGGRHVLERRRADSDLCATGAGWRSAAGHGNLRAARRRLRLVPLDASDSPQIPGAASQGPSAPPAPPAPGAPPQPPSGSWGVPQGRCAPGDASLYIDGRGVGSANQFVGPDLFMALIPGLHRAEVRKSGFKPARVVVEIAASQTHLLHLQLAPDPTGSPAPSGSESDSLTADIPPGGGYFVAPTR